MTTLELPLELWLMIFRHLNYFDLKKCIQVNKFFKSLVNHDSIRGLIIKGNVIPAGQALEVKNLAFHPALDMLRSESYTKIEHLAFVDYESDDLREWKLESTSAASEFATQPASRVIVLRVHAWPVMVVSGKHGVTVLQVMKGLCRLFAKKVPEHLRLQGYEIARDLLGDHTGWVGFDEKTVDTKGRLLLGSEWFDS